MLVTLHLLCLCPQEEKKKLLIIMIKSQINARAVEQLIYDGPAGLDVLGTLLKSKI